MNFSSEISKLNCVDVCKSCFYGIDEIDGFTCLNGTFLDYERKCFSPKNELRDADKEIEGEI